MPRALAATLAALTAVGLAGCAGDGSTRTSTGDTATCPGEVLDVVVSVSQWSDLVRSLAGACADVTTIVASGAVDPHDFEPGTSDLAALAGADLVVVNGGHYDGWAAGAVDTLDPRPALLSAADVAGQPGDDRHADDQHADEDSHGEDAAGDPHLWYDPAVVETFSDAVTDELSRLSPRAEEYFAEQAGAWQDELQPYLDAVEELRAVAPGHSYAATETVFDRMAATVGLTDVTPEGYRRSVSNESEPSPVALAEFESLLRQAKTDVLVVNTQTSGSLVDGLREAAEGSSAVPVVEVTESPPDAEGSFVEWQVAQLEELRTALGGTP